MNNKGKFHKLILILTEVTPLNFNIKINNILTHPYITHDKIHLQLIREYLNDDFLYQQKVKKHLSTESSDNDGKEHLDIEPLFVILSIEFFFFSEILNNSEKKELIINFFNSLDLEFINWHKDDNYIKAIELLAKYKLIYHKELLDLGNNFLKNLEVINELLNVINEQTLLLDIEDTSLSQILEKSNKFYLNKMNYYKEAHSINSKTGDNNIDPKILQLKNLWSMNAKISLDSVLKAGIDNKIWDDNLNIITKRNSIYGSGKALLSSLSISLKNHAYPEIIDPNVLGDAFCTAFNVSIDKNTKEPYKSFTSANPKYTREFKRLLKL
ncbi:hypothetical protein [Winogradskyella schleiferi]|uniref:hypothetical protein n=1 Tax=Winogradskyella schleiferi TaxID=2686078 RepID=UPI0015BD189F|nr:hypothetical protein [Winogradskyella schleiferi]